MMRWIFVGAMALTLAGCSHVVLCCKDHGGMIDSHTFDFTGSTSISCGTNTASIGNTNALGAAAIAMLGAAAKAGVLVGESRVPAPQPTNGAPYVCQ